jgi:hypothetical protein
MNTGIKDFRPRAGFGATCPAGRPGHYFTDSDLKAHFKKMEIVETGILEDPEDHGAEGPHTHRLRYICVKVH